MLGVAPTPTGLTFSNSADCSSFIIAWNYTLIQNPSNPKVYFDWQKCCNTNSVYTTIYNAASVTFDNSVTLLFSDLQTTGGYYFGKTV